VLIMKRPVLPGVDREYLSPEEMVAALGMA